MNAVFFAIFSLCVYQAGYYDNDDNNKIITVIINNKLNIQVQALYLLYTLYV